MKRPSILVCVVTVAVAIVVCLAGRTPVQAQSCVPFRGIAQASLPAESPLHPEDAWGGTAYTALNGEILYGLIGGYEVPGNETQHGGRLGLYQVYLCPSSVPCTDSITYEVQNGVWGFAPGKVGLGNYKGNGAIVSGTGRFAGASGNVSTSGPWILWSDSTSPIGVRGRWNAEIRGNVCGVQ